METTQQLTTALAGRYEIEREIGSGGMATVYLARDIKHHRKVALKVLKPELGAILGVERFLAEIQVTANLQHPNILPLFDSGEANGLLFYVMPFVEGESLRARLDREKQLPIDEAVRYSVAVASALEYAHGHGVIHRDLKPENILLQSGQPVIADFGIALAVSNAGGARITQTGLSLGTPQYMSPEQATGDRAIDGRSDIYSLGAVTYEMLTGEPPHMGKTAQAIIARVLTEHPRDVRTVRSHVPEHVAIALETALEKLPADRWPTARQFADALQGKAGTVSSGTAATFPRSARTRAATGWRARLKDPIVLGVSAVAVAAIATAASSWVAAHRRQADPGVVRFPVTFPRNVVIGPSSGSNVAISRDGRVIALVVSTGSSATQLWVRTLDDVRLRAVPGTDGAQEPFFSPDGRWVGFWANGKLQKAALDGSSVINLAETSIGAGASWGQGDVIVMSLNNGLVTIPASGGAPHVLLRPDLARGEARQQWPLVLPDGKHVLYQTAGRGGLAGSRIGIMSIATGKSTILDLAGVYPLGLIDGHLVYVTAGRTLMAVPFDAGSSRATGPPVPILSDLIMGAVGAAKAAMSAEGSLVYLTGSSVSQLVMSDSRGAVHPVLPETRAYSYPRFSPDGKRIAITIDAASGSDVWLYDIASLTMTRLTSDGAANERPEWSPDGKRVLYRSNRSGRSGLWWQPADLSGEPAPLVASNNVDVFEGVFTPDGRSVVYQIDTAGAQLYYRMLTGDTTAKPIAATAATTDQPRVSPDGHWVAFVSDASGTSQVVVQPFPGPGGQFQVSTTGGTEPVWSRDGHRLYYRDGQQFVAADVVTSPSFAVTSRVMLFKDSFDRGASPHASYDVSPDGAQFLLVSSIESSQAIIAHNWVAELRAKLGVKASK